jgi:predicted HTH domain antitoxin
MTTIPVELPDDALAALRLSPDEFAREILIAAAIHWFQRGIISQGKAAQIAGLPRADFIDELARRKIDVTQVNLTDLREEVSRG